MPVSDLIPDAIANTQVYDGQYDIQEGHVAKIGSLVNCFSSLLSVAEL